MTELTTIERFRADLARLCDVDHDRVLVAVSGGADSLALLLLGHAVLGNRCLAATVDHGTRPETAAEARFVGDLCVARGIAHRTLKLDPLAAALPGNPSARLRQLRYGQLKSAMRDMGVDWIATAHHADDQRETLVMRLNRGAGVAGLAGIRERQDRIIRPLLGWRRHELDAIVATAGLTPVVDPSNTDDRYDRARLRKALAGVDWLDPVRVARSAKAFGDADEALAWTARMLTSAHCDFPETGVATLRPEPLPFELRRRLVEQCLSYLRPIARLRGGEVAAVVDLLNEGREAMLADVRCVVERAPIGTVWRLSVTPPRRAT